jgi:diguanylate cyclase (GGDEF)-like protein/PAS domain S-box-containing protein
MPADDELRVAALHRLGILDTPAEDRFDELVELASLIIDAPIALVSLVDRDRQWFKAKKGLAADETSRDEAFCAHAIVADGPGPFVVEDASTDARFFDNPLVTGGPQVRFYAGEVLHDADGMALGTLCVIDSTPRRLGDAHRQALVRIARLVEREFELRDASVAAQQLRASERSKALILHTLAEGLVLQDRDGGIVEWNPAAAQILGVTGDQLAGPTSVDPWWAAIRPDGSPWPGDEGPAMVTLRSGETIENELMGVRRVDDTVSWVRVNTRAVLDDRGAVDGVLVAFRDVTAETEASRRAVALEEVVRRSEETARISLDSLDHGVVLASATGEVHRLNPAATRILGYSAEELSALWSGQEWITYDESGVQMATDEQPLVRAITTGAAVSDEIVGWRRHDGERILVRLSVVPTAEGLVIGIADITAERLAHRLLDSTLQTAPVGLAILDRNGVIERCNPRFAQHAGYVVDELVGRDVISLLAAEERPRAAAQADRLRRGMAITGALEQRVERPDGTEIWVSSHVATIADPQHALAIAATFDITQQRRMIRDLTRFELLIREANDIVVVVDADGKVTYASPSTERILGYSADCEQHDGIFDVLHADDRPLALDRLRRLASAGDDSEPFVVRVVDRAGTWRHLECVGVNLLHEPAVCGIVITARDATERVRLTEQLAHRAHHDTLTNLPNRRLLDSLVETILQRCAPNERSIGLCFIDLDGFKQINDVYGHERGDTLLVEVARTIRESIRAGDTAARVGGDEFVVILDPIDGPDQARAVAGRIKAAIDRLATNSRMNASFGASVGLALSGCEETAPELMARADAAMYRAKTRRSSSIEVAPAPRHVDRRAPAAT